MRRPVIAAIGLALAAMLAGLALAVGLVCGGDNEVVTDSSGSTPTAMPTRRVEDGSITPTQGPATATPAVTSIPTPPSSPVPTLPPGITVLPPGGSRAATNLQAEVSCHPVELRRGLAALTWTPAERRGSEQRIQVTIYDFERGNFDVSAPLPPGQSTVVWDRVRGQAIHFWRVLTRHDDGWVPSETATFEGPLCVADMAQ